MMMNNQIFDATKLIAYFLWEYTGNKNTIMMWRCAESICQYVKNQGLCSHNKLQEIIRLPRQNDIYKNFVRGIAYRIFLFTENSNEKTNWFCAEKIIFNMECLLAIIKVSSIK